MKIPYGATHYAVVNDRTRYFMRIDKDWMVYYNYDCCSGWGLASSEACKSIKELK